MTSEFATHPVDALSTEKLAANALRYGLVDTADRDSLEAWLQADSRGFHGPAMSKAQIDSNISGVAYRRTVGVWDDKLVAPHIPVATTSSWTDQLTVPGNRTLDAWAISSVTVSPTHRRRGIARALLEGELRSAVDMGLPMAMLTVSESTIYGRYGFGAAVFAANLTIDAQRAHFTSQDRPGTLQPTSSDDFTSQIVSVFDRVRLSHPGQINVWPFRWEQISGRAPGDEEYTKNTRIVRFDDDHGVTRGFVVYRVAGNGFDLTSHKLTVDYLLAETDEAYRALWRYVLEVDLVKEVKAELRSVNEPLLWHVSDMRAIMAVPVDHLWLRILDVSASLSARTYGASGALGFQISDPLGFATGAFVLDIADDGSADVRSVDTLPTDIPAVSLSVDALSSIYLGGVDAETLRASGRLIELTKDAAALVDRSFRSSTTPWLSVWF